VKPERRGYEERVMALLTPMSLAEAAAIGTRFGLKVDKLRPVPHGSVNSNFELGLADGGRAFLRLCEESDHDAVAAQNALLEHLVAAGVPTPAPLHRADGTGSVDRHAGKPVAIFGWCPGSWICQKRVSPAHCERVGAALGRIHRAGEGYRGAPADRFGPAALVERLSEASEAAADREIGDDLVRVAEALDEVAPRVASQLATTVIHGDVFRDNVLWHEEDKLSAVLDFESASLGHPAFDLMVTMLAWCYGDRLERELAQALLAGYQSERSLSASERRACFDQARLAAIRFAITRITDYELRPKGVVVYKDYRRFVGRLAALEAIGADDFVDWLA
jgi:homoserine kinase type II